MEQRHSVREFAEAPVTVEEIMNAVRVAMRTPSVCNRQPTRVHIITDAELHQKAPCHCRADSVGTRCRLRWCLSLVTIRR
ncbi:MAG: nitroreductase family protein [Bifidobacterium sp.]